MEGFQALHLDKLPYFLADIRLCRQTYLQKTPWAGHPKHRSMQNLHTQLISVTMNLVN